MPTARLNHSLRQQFLAELQRKLLPDREWDATAVHRSDLIFCLRKAYFRYTQPRQEDEKLLMLFLRGRTLHTMLEVGEAEYEILSDGIVMHVDDLIDGAFVEKKSTNMKYQEPSKMSEHWYLELAYAASHHPEGTVNLLVLHMNGDYGKNRQPILAGPWEYSFTEAEREMAREWFSGRRNILWHAMEVSEAPSVRYRMEWECRDCNFLDLCATELTQPGSEPYPIPMLEAEYA